MQPSEAYRDSLEHSGFVNDPAQKQAVDALQGLYQELQASTSSNTSSIKRLLCLVANCGSTPVTGVYIWGGVGRGKTWLMNLFYESLPFDQKLRLHFHHFMLGVHEKLTELQGQKKPVASDCPGVRKTVPRPVSG